MHTAYFAQTLAVSILCFSGVLTAPVVEDQRNSRNRVQLKPRQEVNTLGTTTGTGTYPIETATYPKSPSSNTTVGYDGDNQSGDSLSNKGLSPGGGTLPPFCSGLNDSEQANATGTASNETTYETANGGIPNNKERREPHAGKDGGGRNFEGMDPAKRAEICSMIRESMGSSSNDDDYGSESATILPRGIPTVTGYRDATPPATGIV